MPRLGCFYYDKAAPLYPYAASLCDSDYRRVVANSKIDVGNVGILCAISVHLTPPSAATARLWLFIPENDVSGFHIFRPFNFILPNHAK